MLIYIFLIFFLLLLSTVTSGSYFSIEIKKVFLFVAVLTCVLVSALRYGIGGDYAHYVDEFNSIGQFGASSSYTEIGYSYLSQALYNFGFSEQSIFVVSSIILGASIYYFIKNNLPENYWGFAVVLFVLFGFFFSSMNVLRQYLATAFCIFGFIFLKNKKIFPFIFFVFFGCMFHTIVLIFAILPLLISMLRSRNAIILLTFLYILSLLTIFVDVRPVVADFITIIPRWSGYVNSTFFTDRNNLALVKIIFPNIVFIVYIFALTCKRRMINNKDIDLYSIFPVECYLVAGTFCYTFFQNIFYGVMVGTRLSEVFFMLYIAFIIEMVSTIKNSAVRFFCIGLIVSYGIILTIVTIFMMNGNGVVPYQSIL